MEETVKHQTNNNMKKFIAAIAAFTLVSIASQAQNIQVVDHACWTGSVSPVLNLVTINTRLGVPFVRPTSMGVVCGVSWRTFASYHIVANITTRIDGKTETKNLSYDYSILSSDSTVQVVLPFTAMCGKDKNYAEVKVWIFKPGSTDVETYSYARVDGR